MAFDKKEYDKKFHDKNYTQVNIKLRKEDKEELDKLLSKLNISSAEFLRRAIEKEKQGMK
ncbi:MAG: ribbon-helix-helix protein, CopG family [Bacilli bacterium]|nr:ribbon-helix-helix protein, CopG family [Bacilli bacterium]